MSHSVQWQAEQCERENRVILHDVPALLNALARSSVLESNEYQNTHDEYMCACQQLKQRISQLHCKMVALSALGAFQSYRTDARPDLHGAHSVPISSAMKLRLHQHASFISLAVARHDRENKFRAVQGHVHTLQDLRSRHDLALDQVRTSVRSRVSPHRL
jgi:hypothetical protein